MIAPEPVTAASAKLDPLSLVFSSSGVVLLVLVLLVLASFGVWVIWLLKWAQLKRLRHAQQAFETLATQTFHASDLIALALKHRDAPGARVLIAIAKRHPQPNVTRELLQSVAQRALVTEQQRAGILMPTLSSIASASPFVGLFGTVWGIMDAFLRIGMEKSASLPVVAPAIGEALIATAFGLVAAIPATVGYNFVEQRISDLLGEVEASANTWVELLVSDPTAPTSAVPLIRQSDRPPRR